MNECRHYFQDRVRLHAMVLMAGASHVATKGVVLAKVSVACLSASRVTFDACVDSALSCFKIQVCSIINLHSAHRHFLSWSDPLS